MELLISGDFNRFNEGYGKDVSAVYMASGLAPSSFERPIYVGSAVDLKKRIQYGHIPDLIAGRHRNPLLQNYVKKNGINSLVWFALEYCPREQTLEREDVAFGELQPFAASNSGFNIGTTATAPMKGRSHSHETKKKMSATHKGREHSPEVRQKIAVKMKGKKNRQGLKNSSEHRERMREGSRYRMTSQWLTHRETNETVLAEGINLFCAQRAVVRANLFQVIKGNRKQANGWRLATPEEIKRVEQPLPTQ